MTLNWVDSALLACMALGGILGYLRGFILMVAGLLAYAFGLFIAGRYAAPTLEWLDAVVSLSRTLAPLLASYVHLPTELADTPVHAFPVDRIRSILDGLPFPGPYRVAILDQVTQALGQDANLPLSDWLFNLLAQGILRAATFLVLLIGGAWVFRKVARLLSGLFNALPLTGLVNRLLGATMGTAAAALTIALILGVLAPLLSFPSFSFFGESVGAAATAPYFTRAYQWMAGWLFGKAGVYFLGA